MEGQDLEELGLGRTVAVGKRMSLCHTSARRALKDVSRAGVPLMRTDPSCLPPDMHPAKNLSCTAGLLSTVITQQIFADLRCYASHLLPIDIDAVSAAAAAAVLLPEAYFDAYQVLIDMSESFSIVPYQRRLGRSGWPQYRCQPPTSACTAHALQQPQCLLSALDREAQIVEGDVARLVLHLASRDRQPQHISFLSLRCPADAQCSGRPYHQQ